MTNQTAAAYSAYLYIDGVREPYAYVTEPTMAAVAEYMADVNAATVRAGGRMSGDAVIHNGKRYHYTIEPVKTGGMHAAIAGYLDGHPADRPNGLCKVCLAEDWECEPDAQKYHCDNCGNTAVFGFEELCLA